MGCGNCSSRMMYGNGFGLGITTDQSGQSWLGGKKIVGWQGNTPMTWDPKTGQLFANILNLQTGQYMPGVAMPTTVTARHGGWGPIATAPTGSGRVFWAEGEDIATKLIQGWPVWASMLMGAWFTYNLCWKEHQSFPIVQKVLAMMRGDK